MFCENPIINAHVERLLPISHLLCDPNNEVSINGGRVWIDPGSGDMQDIGIIIVDSAVHTAIRLLVAANGGYLDPGAPFATLTLACGARFHAALQPVSDEPRISIRRHAPAAPAQLSHLITPPTLSYMGERGGGWIVFF